MSILQEEDIKYFDIFNKKEHYDSEYFGAYLNDDKEVCICISGRIRKIAERLGFTKEYLIKRKCVSKIDGTLERCLSEDMYSESWRCGKYTICRFVELEKE